MSYGYFCTLAYFLLLIPLYWRYRHRRIAVLIAWGLLSSVYESGVGRLWLSKDAIRLDIFAVLILTALGYTLIALAYWINARQRNAEPAQVARRHALYLMPQLGLMLGMMFYLLRQSQLSEQRIGAAQKHFLAACWRTPSTQQRCFGELHQTRSGASGYFRNTTNDATYRDLLINQAGGFSLITATNYLLQGQLSAQTDGSYALLSSNIALDNARLQQTEAGNWQLRLSYAQHQQTFQFQRQPLPNAANLPSGKTQLVNFVGVFSALEKNATNFWLTQVWIWRDQHASWGYLFRNNLSYGEHAEFLSVSKWQQVCQRVCDDQHLQFHSPIGQSTLSQNTATQWQLNLGAGQPTLTLHAGQYIPVLMLDQAPLETREQNQQWLAELTSLYHSAWRIPASDQLRPF